MEINTAAGEFQMTAFTDGYPVNVYLKRDGQEIARMSHDQLADLEYVVSRMRQRLKSKVREGEV